MWKTLKVVSQKSSGTEIASVYVYGERNSGTNFVYNLVFRNCISKTGNSLYNPENRNILGWKHGFPSIENGPGDVLAIAVYREPIAWLHSLNRAPWHAPLHMWNLPFSRFIRTRWQSVINDAGFGVQPGHPLWARELMADRDPMTGRRFANAMQLRNAKLRGFATLDHRFGNVLRVRYETVVADPEGFLNALCKSYGFRRTLRFDPILHDRATPSRGVFCPKPVPPVATTDMDFICAQLDLQQELALGYDVERGRQIVAA